MNIQTYIVLGIIVFLMALSIVRMIKKGIPCTCGKDCKNCNKCNCN